MLPNCLMRPAAVIAALFVSLLLAVPTNAQSAAMFEGDQERERILIVLAESGDFLISTHEHSYFLYLSGQAYWIESGPGGPQATTAQARAHQEKADRASGRLVMGPRNTNAASTEFRPIGSIQIAGRTGTRYENEAGWTPIVLSDDPNLLPLGRAWRIYQQAIDMGRADEGRSNMLDLLETRGILSVWGRQLKGFLPVPPERFEGLASAFELPDDALTLDMLLAAEANAPPPRPDNHPYNPVLGGVYFDDALWTHLRDGSLMRWDEGADAGTLQDIDGIASDLCVFNGELLAVTARNREGQRLQLVRLVDGEWVQELRFKADQENPFFALDCSGEEPLLLTAKALLLPRTEREIAIDTQILAPGPYFVTIQHEGWLYVGSNVGEWGGGLRRISLADGRGERIENRTEALCGGMLNTDCAPVTGLSIDPANPHCVLASVGLVHMMSSGHVVRVCSGQVSLAYRKPITLDQHWEWTPGSSDMRGYSSVPFFAMAGGQGIAIAAAGDGLYRFHSASQSPEFIPFGRTARWPASGIDWSDPDVILVATSMNARHSLSGSSILIVPRK